MEVAQGLGSAAKHGTCQSMDDCLSQASQAYQAQTQHAYGTWPSPGLAGLPLG